MAVRRRIVLVGATGAFGARLAKMLAAWPDVTLVLAARRAGPLAALAGELRAGGAAAAIEVAAFDRARPEGLASLAPWAVVDAAGPFQASDLRLPRAAIAAGAHYVDLADGRAFVAAFPAALDAEARSKGVLAIAGASSTPALSHAVLDRLTAGWRAVDRITVAISPGAKAPRGLSVVQGILSYVGRPVRLFEAGAWRTRPGWSVPRRLLFPGLGRRWVCLCETPDLDLIPARFAPREQALFAAGLELAPMHLGLWLLSWLVRLRLLRDLVPLARPLRAVAGWLAAFGSDRGGMVVVAEGQGADGERRAGRWSLAAEANAGPNVPVAAAAALLRGLHDGRIGRTGAAACVGLLTLDDILAELAVLPIATRLETLAPPPVSLFAAVMGEAFAGLPAAVAHVHGGAAAAFRGRARARGSAAWPVAAARAFLGLPQPGRYPQISVEIAGDASGETWTRRFGAGRFRSRLTPAPGRGGFEERFGPATFAFAAEPIPRGFRWCFLGWRLGPLPMPRWLAPAIRARAFEAGGVYRFRVLAAHPWLGVIFAYAGRLQ